MTDNSTHLSGDEAPASTSDSPQTAVATPPKRVNFPLPRELRDQIYGYLLHHEYTEHSKYAESSAQGVRLASSYKFHTSILAVNTQIGEEATEVLRSNDFVLVTMNWSLNKALKAFEVPIVCDLSYCNIQFGHLRIDYKLHAKPGCMLQDERKFVVIRFGLIKLCKLLQYHHLGHPSFAPVVLHGIKDASNPHHPFIRAGGAGYKRYKFGSSINVHDRVRKPLSRAKKRRLLEPFRNLIIGGQLMEIDKILPEPELANFKLFMAPPVVNSLPLTWCLLDLTREMKAAADQHVLTGCFTKASQLYGHTLRPLGQFELSTKKARTVPGVLCVLVLIDIYLCRAMMELSTSWPGDAEEWLRYANATLSVNADLCQAFSPEFKIGSVEIKVGSARNMALFWLAMLCRVAERHRSGLQAIKYCFKRKENFRAIMALNDKEKVADYFDHDVNYLGTLIPEDDDDETATVPVVDKNKLSLFQLPPLIFDFPLPDGWSKPVDWFGFLDREMYEYMLNKGLVSAP
ncbi:hypothetical protein KC315_g6522 [Hortaea werneckii]|nr:hypothetical protein KC315_g6522 [Hortaea werneckii]